MLRHFGTNLSPLGALEKGLGGVLGLSWDHQAKKENSFSASPPRGPKSRLLVASWTALGPVLGPLGPVLGLSWARLGALLGHPGAILRLQEPVFNEKAREQKTSILLRFLKDVGFPGGFLGALEGF